ncbi:hypothetical protein OJF2_58370 [Aquisphaera giovannonii]|uniref:SGNH hydrolase-type esterase domain-containing protein n=1 Tax=Aquisphaera giovannonii TaxID=406548 RepID=A0A5B9WBJ2_9BACT|nr:hypothetical protein [Aquisphaera giovannonii]QEH37250.1 hypothetical protein OJF2_58370 [Aquisphaera giovannonii]
MARFLRLAIAGAAVAFSVLLLVGACYWLGDRISPRRLWQLRLGFLIGLEVAYDAVVLALLIATPSLAIAAARARRRRASRPGIAKALLLAVSLLFTLIAAEAAAAIWHTRSSSANRIPVVANRAAERGGVSVEDAGKVVLPVDFPEREPDAPAEILVLGESSAAGVPYDWWLSPGLLVAWQLHELMPGRTFHCTVLATSGHTLAQQHRALAAANLARRPDVVIIYSGHNEFTARLPWSREVDHYLDANDSTPWERIAALAPRWSPLCRLIREEADKCRVAIPPPRGGYRNLVDVPAFAPDEYRAILDGFERTLDTLVAYTRRIGALPILIAPAGNDSDYEPNRSYLPEATPSSERAAFAREFLAARQLEATDPAESLRRYRSLDARQTGFAELHHRMARLTEASGDWEGSYRHALAARDLDGYPQRLPTSFQLAYRRVAARHACTLIDAQAVFHAVGEHGLLDDHLFHDGVHPALRGQIALAQEVLQAIRDRSALGWPAGRPAPVIDPKACAAQFHLTPWAWEKVCNFGIMFYDLTEGARYDPSERVAKRHAFGQGLERIKAGAAPESVGLPNIGVPPPARVVPEAVTIPPPPETATASR